MIMPNDTSVPVLTLQPPKPYEKTILGADCALDLNSIENICNNLKRFMEWSLENCKSGDKRIQALERRCEKINQIKTKIQASWSD